MKVIKVIYIAIVLTLLGISIPVSVQAQKTDLKWHIFEEALQLAEETGKPIMVDVWAPWCGWCKKMEKEVYPEISANFHEDFILTRLNRDDNESRKKYKHVSLTPLRLSQKLNVQQVPAIVMLSPEGEYLFHLSGFTEAEKLKEILGYVVE
ncbi:thioredoxin family protein [Gracilimonas sp.]|uniref:thioredoxin family protein n=1 Tax=Gracilimonas sp. TaxID=1974203 RepID=UPI00287126B0|nr:thioredoxin family protein [Gracilimonas sp.]